MKMKMTYCQVKLVVSTWLIGQQSQSRTLISSEPWVIAYVRSCTSDFNDRTSGSKYKAPNCFLASTREKHKNRNQKERFCFARSRSSRARGERSVRTTDTLLLWRLLLCYWPVKQPNECIALGYARSAKQFLRYTLRGIIYPE